MHNTPVRKAIVGRQLNPGLTVLRTIPAVIGLGLFLTAGVYGSASAPQQTLTPGADDFIVEVTPAAATISPGGEVAIFTVTVRRINGFNRTIFLSVETNRLDEARASFDPALAWFSPGGRDQAKLEVYYQPLYGRPSIAIVNVTVVAEATIAVGETLRHTKSVTVNIGTNPARPPRPAPQGTSDAPAPAGPVPPTNPNSPATVSAGTPTINKPPTPRFAPPSRFMVQSVSGTKTNAFGQGHRRGAI